MKLLIDEAIDLNPETGPWKTQEAPGEYDGEDWLLASLGCNYGGKGVHVTTDRVHASETCGSSPEDLAQWIVWCRNHWRSILEALDANGSVAGTDEEKIEARIKLESWNRGEPIRAAMPDAEIAVFFLPDAMKVES
jgi:hypothetical protein